MRSKSSKSRGQYLILGLAFGFIIGGVLQTFFWGATLGMAIGLTWEYAHLNKVKN